MSFKIILVYSNIVKFQNGFFMRFSLFIFTLCISISANSELTLPVIGADSIYLNDQEDNIGRSFMSRFKQINKPIDDPLVNYYLEDILNTLLQPIGRTKREYEITLFNQDAINAFAVPGGYIGLYSGLIFLTQTESQLATVIAHEIAHVELEHSLQMLEQRELDTVLAISSILLAIVLNQNSAEEGSDAPEAILFAGAASQYQSIINFTRENEYEADRLGLSILESAGYSVKGMIEFFRLMEKSSLSETDNSIEYLRTHPFNSNREAEVLNGKVVANLGQKQSLEFKYFKIYLNFILNDYFEYQGNEINLQNYQKAMGFLNKSEFSKAEILIKNIIKYEPNNIWLIKGLLSIYRESKQYQKALSTINKSLLMQPTNYWLRLEELYLLEATNKNEKLFSQAVIIQKKWPEKSSIYPYLVRLYEAKGEVYNARKTEAKYLFIRGHYERSMAIYQWLLKHSKNIIEIKKIKQKIKNIKKIIGKV